MRVRMRLLAVTWVGVLAAVGTVGGTLEALGAPEPAPAPSATVTVHAASALPAATPTALAQSALPAGPLEGPLGPSNGSGSACCPCRPVHHVVHHRVARRSAPVVVAQAPIVPLVPYRPVYVYRPLIAYRPLVPLYGYRPFFYRPYIYGRGFY